MRTMSKNNLFFDPTLKHWRCITEELPEKPDLLLSNAYGERRYKIELDKYNDRIAELKRNALTVVNPEVVRELAFKRAGLPDIEFLEVSGEEGKLYEWPYEIQKKTIFSDGWLPSYNDPSNSGAHPVSEPIEDVVFLILPNSQSKDK